MEAQISTQKSLPAALSETSGGNMLSSRARFLRESLTGAKRVPLNDYGLPIGVYRPDFLPSDPYYIPPEESTPSKVVDDQDGDGHSLTLSDDEGGASQEGEEVTEGVAVTPPRKRISLYMRPEIQVAFLPLEYGEGFPSLGEGIPFWYQLAWESSEAFSAFEEYLRQGRGGARSILTTYEMLPEHLRRMIGYDDMQEASWLNYWGVRAKAFDMFDEALRRRQRALAAADTEDSHALLAERMTDMALSYMNSEEFMQEMTPKTALEMLKQAVILRRISLGLPANGPSSQASGEGNGSTSMEVILRSFADKNADTVINGDTGDIEGLDMTDPAVVELAQELVIRMQTGG